MELHDKVYIPCPKCGRGFYWQSKVGKSDMSIFGLDNMPVEIAKEILSKIIWCKYCGYNITLKLKVKYEFEAV
jgi:DNA-directed RNA polymerase subunit RPC12/RpoP